MVGSDDDGVVDWEKDEEVMAMRMVVVLRSFYASFFALFAWDISREKGREFAIGIAVWYPSLRKLGYLNT